MTGPIGETPAEPVSLGSSGLGAPAGRGGGIWGPAYVWVTVGSVALVFLAAIQSLAVTTVMPVVSADLDGASLYAVAFAGTLATSVIGMVAVGAWCDRGGVLAPLSVAVALFVAGLVIAGLAPSMEVLVAGRLIQGLGTGGQTVALYVVVARVYPGRPPRARLRGIRGGVGAAIAHRAVPRRRGRGVPALAVGVPRRRGAHDHRLHDGGAATARPVAAHR